MEQKTKEYRERLANVFLQSLEEKQLDWKKGWSTSSGFKPRNAATQGTYKGINRFYLSLIALEKGYTDNRWATFKQIKDKHWKLQKGSEGVGVEYWMPFDSKTKKIISWEDCKVIQANEAVDSTRILLKAKHFTVFHASNIEGIPPLPEVEKHNVNPDALIEKISKSMEVPILHDGNEQAYYSPKEDQIHLPKIETFLNDYEYNATALHELAHSTGAEKRLNRVLSTFFGSNEYAYEELVAEISSCFMSDGLRYKQSDTHVDNHKAYVQNWISGLQNKPEIMIQAIRDAERVADYIGIHAELIPEKEYKKSQESRLEVKEDQIAKTAPATASETPAVSITEIKLKPKLKQKLQNMEKAGVKFSVSKNGKLLVPDQVKEMLSKEEIGELNDYLKVKTYTRTAKAVELIDLQR